MIKPRIALIDGDVICYQLAYKNKDWPIEYCLADTDDFIADVMTRSNSDAYEMYLTGSNNFRDTLAVSKPYKGNRKTEKPDHFYPVKEHLLKRYSAIVAEDCEADDLMGVAQTKADQVNYETIICTVDKDLKMIPGLHYSWRNRDGIIEVTADEGQRFFFTQWLTGDATDNIPGAVGIGIKKATELLEDCTTKQEMYEAVQTGYTAKGHDEAYMDEQAHLIWMQRHGQLKYTDFIQGD